MIRSVRNVTEILDDNNIEYDLRTSLDTPLPFPVAISQFNGQGLTFYTGDDITLLKKWEGSHEGLIIASSSLSSKTIDGPFLFVSKPRQTFVLASYLFVNKKESEIHPTALIDKEASIGHNISIGPYTVIGAAIIGDNVQIGSHCVITDDVEIGNDVKIFSSVNLGEPGLGSILDSNDNNTLFPHFSKLIIEDKVVIGSGTMIDQGALTSTIIEKNVHISKCCSIGHNSSVGKGSFISHNVHIGGSSTIGKHCWIAIGACIKDSITIADEVTIGINATVTKSCLNSGTTIMGIPSKEYGSMFSCARIQGNQK